jgi:hypothetical protein
MAWCRVNSEIEDWTCQEAMRWPGAIQQQDTLAKKQSVFWPTDRNSMAEWPRIDCDAGVTFETGWQNHASRQAQTHS